MYHIEKPSQCNHQSKQGEARRVCSRTRLDLCICSDSIMACPICFEEFSSKTEGNGSIISLEICSHRFCVDCFLVFLKTCEGNGTTMPRCPSCRRGLAAREITRILGREYTPAGCNRYLRDDEEQIDEFTLTLLQEMGVRQCGNCGAQIFREEGCRAVQCLCGYRFCYECTLPMDQCSCNDGVNNFAFFDNLVGVEVEFCDVPPPVASEEDIVNLRAFIDRSRERGLARRRDEERRREVSRRRAEVFSNACRDGDFDRVNGMLRDENAEFWSELIAMVIRLWFKDSLPLGLTITTDHLCLFRPMERLDDCSAEGEEEEDEHHIYDN